MRSCWRAQVDDHVQLRDLAKLVSSDRATTAALLANWTNRNSTGSAAHPSICHYCVRELRMSDDTAYRHMESHE